MHWNPIPIVHGSEPIYSGGSSRNVSTVLYAIESSPGSNFVVRSQLYTSSPIHFDRYVLMHCLAISKKANISPAELSLVCEVGDELFSRITVLEKAIEIDTQESHILYFFRRPLDEHGLPPAPWGFWSADPDLGDAGVVQYFSETKPSFWSRPHALYASLTTNECIFLQLLEDRGILPRFDVEFEQGPSDKLKETVKWYKRIHTIF
ncbi:hypothetical protein SISSUDRAFT_252788 [Sistotremastrum suecicum HHB10207 ss-3]|uniref:Uncharacterized protein n=1 Tax=Sistotremastrum suecicum HHB10207 ss-3 TaxID=1314776 RepID=A0A165ZW49_9AGAM|nr:hypothetical protein SISSUDRAFT_252788 [Sistotremastrum suecicum HHB10207 ss-3]